MPQFIDSNKNNLLNLKYSKEEQFTGMYWLDGKKIYQKGYTGTLPSAQTTLDKIEGIENLLFCAGTAGPIYSWYIGPNQHFSDGYRWTVNKFGNSILINSSEFSKGASYQLVILYTKE